MATAKAKGKTTTARRRSRNRQAAFVDFSADELDEAEIVAFRQLPKHTREWTLTLTESKTAKIDKLVRVQELAESLGWGAKWIFIGTVTIFGGIGTIIYGWNLLQEKLAQGAVK